MWPGVFSNLCVYSMDGSSKRHCNKNKKIHSKNHKVGYGYLTKPCFFFFFYLISEAWNPGDETSLANWISSWVNLGTSQIQFQIFSNLVLCSHCYYSVTVKFEGKGIWLWWNHLGQCFTKCGPWADAVPYTVIFSKIGARIKNKYLFRSFYSNVTKYFTKHMDLKFVYLFFLKKSNLAINSTVFKMYIYRSMVCWNKELVSDPPSQ